MLGKNLLLKQFVEPSVSSISLGPLGTVGDIHVDTLILSCVCMGGILAASALIAPTLVAEGAGSPLQGTVEGFYNFIDDLAKKPIGHHYKTFLPLIAAIFIFVLMGNLIGIGPWKALEGLPGWFHLPNGEPFELAAPTTDFNVPLGLAVVSLVTYLGSGFWKHGFGYFKHLANPIEWLDLVVRPSTLTFRLMLVITADELIRTVSLMLAPWLVPSGVMAFEIFIAGIQAYVFALLTSIYIGLTVAEHH